MEHEDKQLDESDPVSDPRASYPSSFWQNAAEEPQTKHVVYISQNEGI